MPTLSDLRRVFWRFFWLDAFVVYIVLVVIFFWHDIYSAAAQLANLAVDQLIRYGVKP